MRVDFYQLSRDPVERVVAMLARKVLGSGARLLVVHHDAAMRKSISQELWRARPEEFLANGEAGAKGAAQQPILLSGELEASNGAEMLIVANGKWHPDARAFKRALFIFGADEIEGARALWRELDGIENLEREIHKQDEQGRWRAGG